MTREEQILRQIRSECIACARALRGHKIVLFGSRAAGRAHDRSDFDIGIEGNAPLDIRSFMELKDRLESIRTLYSIDLVDLRKCPSRFRAEALKETKTLYESTHTP